VTDRPYSRIYHQIVDDPDFDRVYGNRTALGAWLQMLLTADAMYPASAPMPPRDPTVRLLIASGLIIERPGNRYSVKGLQAERERRSATARNAAAVRWHSKGNADAMPRRDETSRDKTSIGANAPTEPFMGFRPKSAPGSHDGQHGETCMVCFPPSEQKVRVVK
jgi:hypothetical protein